jgi:hypothetical protein
MLNFGLAETSGAALRGCQAEADPKLCKVEGVILNALAARLCRLISCAFGNPSVIVFREADPPWKADH